MTTIPASAIAKFEQLRQMATIATATSDGLKPEVDHWRAEITRLSIELSDVRRQHGDLEAGPSGEAYVSRQRRTTSNSSGRRIESYDVSSERRPDLDIYTLPLWNAQQRLSMARSAQAEASARAGGFKQVVAEARDALRARGWTEGR